MERKMNVADFAALVGTTTKTIYEKINNSGELPVIEQLITVNEKVKGRTIKLILTNSEQIEYYKNLYGKNTVIDGEYYENVTVNNLNKPVNEIQESVKTSNNNEITVNVLNQFITVNNELNERYEQKITEYIKVNNELAELKSKQLLLEDKAGREGMYLNEINDLKQDHSKEIDNLKHLHTDEINELKRINNRYKLFNKGLITVIIVLLIVIIGYITFIIGVNKSNSTTEQSSAIESINKEQVQPAPAHNIKK